MTKHPLATLVHISDLHFGEKFTTDETLFKMILAQIPFVTGVSTHSYQVACALSHRINMILKDRKEHHVPTCIVFTGDLTSSGKKEEFIVGDTFLREAFSFGADMFVGLKAREAHGTKKTPIAYMEFIALQKKDMEHTLFVVPGNHDIWQRDNPDALGAYHDHFPGSYPKTLMIQTHGRPIMLYGLDSTQNEKLRHRLALGRVPQQHLDRLCDMIQSVKLFTYDDAIHIVCLHHSLFSNEWQPMLQLDNCDAIAQRMFDAGADLVLSGHIHVAKTREERMDFPNHAVAGTATQQFSNRGFFVLDIYKRGIELAAFQYDKQYREFVIDNTVENIRCRHFALHPGKDDQLAMREKENDELSKLLESIKKPDM